MPDASFADFGPTFSGYATAGAGTTQATAKRLTARYSVVAGAAGSGVVLPAVAVPGVTELLVLNIGDNAMRVYPPLGATINFGTVNVPVLVPAGGTYRFLAFDPPTAAAMDWACPEAMSMTQMGTSWYVNAGTGSDLNDGTASSPFATIMAAHAAASEGDTIYIFVGTYDENLIISKAGLSLIGIVRGGYERPDITPASGSALQVTTGQGFYAQHMRFASDDSDSVIQYANGFVYDCVFDGSGGQAATECNLRLVPSPTDDSYSASEGVIKNSLIRGSGGSGIIMQHALAAGGGEGTTDNVIENNRFVGNAVSDLLSAVNTNGGGAGIYQRLSVTGNQFMTVGAAYVYIDFTAGVAGDLSANSGLISGNYFADEAIIAAQIVLAGQPNVMFTGNYDAAGLIDGTTFNN